MNDDVLLELRNLQTIFETAGRSERDFLMAYYFPAASIFFMFVDTEYYFFWGAEILIPISIFCIYITAKARIYNALANSVIATLMNYVQSAYGCNSYDYGEKCFKSKSINKKIYPREGFSIINGVKKEINESGKDLLIKAKADFDNFYGYFPRHNMKEYFLERCPFMTKVRIYFSLDPTATAIASGFVEKIGASDLALGSSWGSPRFNSEFDWKYLLKEREKHGRLSTEASS